MNMTLEQLLTTRVSRDLCCKELDLNAEVAAHLNKVQATEAIRQAKVHCTTTTYTFQQAHQESVLELECQMMAEERQVCQAFMEAFMVTIQACSPNNWGALLYPLQLLTCDVPLACLLWMSATAQLHAVEDGGPAPVSSIPNVSRWQYHKWVPNASTIPQPRMYQPQGKRRRKQQTINDPPKEHPCHKQKERKPAAKALKEPQWEAFSKESEVVKVARWAYFKAHQPNFKQ